MILFSLFMLMILIGLIILQLISLWKLFEKMGEPGWKGILPIVNSVTISERVGKPVYWGLLVFIPYIGIVWNIWLLNLWLKKFGKDEGYTVLTIFFGLITIPILAFGDSQWQDHQNKIDHQEIDQIGNGLT